MMKVTPRASFVIGVESSLTEEKADEIAKVVQSVVKGMAGGAVKISFQRHFSYQEDNRAKSPSPFSVY